MEEDRAVRLYASRKITEAQLDHQRKFITERLESLREKLVLMENVVGWARRIGFGLDDLPDEQRREVLRLLLDEVTIDGEKTSISRRQSQRKIWRRLNRWYQGARMPKEAPRRPSNTGRHPSLNPPL